MHTNGHVSFAGKYKPRSSTRKARWLALDSSAKSCVTGRSLSIRFESGPNPRPDLCSLRWWFINADVHIHKQLHQKEFCCQHVSTSRVLLSSVPFSICRHAPLAYKAGDNKEWHYSLLNILQFWNKFQTFSELSRKATEVTCRAGQIGTVLLNLKSQIWNQQGQTQWVGAGGYYCHLLDPLANC